MENLQVKTADGRCICVEVTTEVKELLAQSDRQIHSQRRQDRRNLDYMDFIDELTDTTMNYPQKENPADLIIEKERNQQLHEAINALPEIQRKRLLLYFMNELTYTQIAEREGVNQVTVYRSVKRALRRLYKSLTN